MYESQQKQLRLLQKLVYLMPGTVYWKDRQCRHMGCNRTLQEIIGLDKPEDIIGKSNDDLYSQEIAKPLNIIDERIMSSGKAETLEEVGYDINGERAIYLTTKTPWVDENTGEVIGLWGHSMDITLEREAQQNILEAKKYEEATCYLQTAIKAVANDVSQAVQQVEEAFANIEDVLPVLLKTMSLAQAHALDVASLRQDKLNLFSGAVARSYREINFIKKYIDKTVSNICHSRIKHKNIKQFRMSYLIQQAIEHYPFKPDEQDLVHYRVEHDFDYVGNEFYFYNMLHNLLSNALYYIQKNHRGQIVIWTEFVKNHHVVYFKDTAEGIATDLLSKIFSDYFSTRQNSTGLGLTFCRSVMRELGGEITVKSQPGEYVTFALIFPNTRAC